MVGVAEGRCKGVPHPFRGGGASTHAIPVRLVPL